MKRTYHFHGSIHDALDIWTGIVKRHKGETPKALYYLNWGFCLMERLESVVQVDSRLWGLRRLIIRKEGKEFIEFKWVWSWDVFERTDDPDRVKRF